MVWVKSWNPTAETQVDASGKIYRKPTDVSVITRNRGRSYEVLQYVFIVTRGVQFNVTAFLNRNNNGGSKEADRDVETAATLAGSKSYQVLPQTLGATRQTPRYSYLNRRHPEAHRTRSERETRPPVQHHRLCVGIETKATAAVQSISGPNQDRRAAAEVFSPRCQTSHGYGKLSLHEDIDVFETGNKEDPATSDVSVQTDHQCGPPCFSELFQEVSLFKSVSEVPESVKKDLLRLLCAPLLDGGYQRGGCAWSSLLSDPAGRSHPRPCLAGLQEPFHSAVTDISGSYELLEGDTPEPSYENTQVDDLCYRGSHRAKRESSSSEGFQKHVLSYYDFTSDLCLTENSPPERAESLHSFLHEAFSLEDDILDIPTLSILSPPHASLGQAFHNDHDVSSLSILDHDEDKLASHEPFPSEYVFKRVCGPSFSMSSEFWHIKIPILPSHMINYKVETDGLTEIVIGSGSFGEVYAATLTVSPGQSRDVVVKQHFTDRTRQEAIANEAKITMYLESTGCVPICYGLLSDEEDGYKIVMEYVGSGQTLRDVICESDVPKLHWLNIACQLASGLNKIHKKDVLINDIKSDNILVDMSGELPSVKFCDMGTASYKSGVTYRGNMKNGFHLAPETRAHARTTPACDVYSLGRVLKKIHCVSHISVLLSLSDMCMAEDPAVRPTLWTVNQRLQEENTKEALFPTLTVPSHGYLDSIHEEPEEESARTVLKVNTPIDKDPPTAVLRDNKPSRSNRIIGCSQVSPSNMKLSGSSSNELLGAPVVLHTGSQRKIASVSRSPNFRVQTKALGSKDISDPTRGHVQGTHDTAFSKNSPACRDQVLETESQGEDDRCISTEVAETTSDATKKSFAEGSSVSYFATPESSISTKVAEKTSAIATRKNFAGPSSVSYFATPESSISTKVAEKTSAIATRKNVAGPSSVCHTATPEASSTEVTQRSQTTTEARAPHVAAIHCQCEAELDAYKQCGDTPAYDDYLPLILPILMLLFGVFGVV
ncbi:uncharacterized protein [Haliotis cracherodii]|uniref:uncharacterized protein n=1 Tax=Haliotis cracherodii TaxID=6455 RepID=UPI0039E775B9